MEKVEIDANTVRKQGVYKVCDFGLADAASADGTYETAGAGTDGYAHTQALTDVLLRMTVMVIDGHALFEMEQTSAQLNLKRSSIVVQNI